MLLIRDYQYKTRLLLLVIEHRQAIGVLGLWDLIMLREMTGH